MKPSISCLRFLILLLFLCAAAGACENKSRQQHAVKKNPPVSLAEKLAAIDVEDQRYRVQIVSLLTENSPDSVLLKALQKKMHHADSVNLSAITDMLDHTGWPDPKDVGIEGSRTVWAVLQHGDLPTQEKYLNAVSKAVADKKLEARYLGYFTDRISIEKGERQKYGTQLFTLGREVFVLPLADPRKADLWRKEIGLVPLNQYLKEAEGIDWTLDQYYRNLPEGEKILIRNRSLANLAQSR